MQIIEPYYEILHMAKPNEIYSLLELAARTCYKSEDKIGPGTAENLLRKLMKTGHESIIEHISISVRIVCDRGITHELVRHRLCSFSQESTRYANYGKEKFGREITVIRPIFWPTSHPMYSSWKNSMTQAEKIYMVMLDNGAKPQEARSVLPNSLKTEIITTANIRQFKHMFKLRCGKAAHPQIRQIMLPLLAEFHSRIPVFYEELFKEHEGIITKLKVTGML